MIELHEMFEELALLVQAQGEDLDNIEKHFKETNDYLEKAEVHMDKTKEIEDGTRDKMFWFLIILGAIGILVMIFLIYF